MINLTTYHVLHLSSIIVLLAYTFYAFAAPAETRRRVLMVTGVAALLVIVTGVGMLHRLGLGFPGWAIVKLVCLLGLASITGIAYKRRAQADLFMLVALVLAITAVAMVYMRPF
jgi:ABC-type transport system involved in cytochrome c biogenesis permease subunit